MDLMAFPEKDPLSLQFLPETTKEQLSAATLYNAPASSLNNTFAHKVSHSLIHVFVCFSELCFLHRHFLPVMMSECISMLKWK